MIKNQNHKIKSRKIFIFFIKRPVFRNWEMLNGVRRAIMASSVRAQSAQVVNNAPMKDQDRIFTNIYGYHDFKLKGKWYSYGNT